MVPIRTQYKHDLGNNEDAAIEVKSAPRKRRACSGGKVNRFQAGKDTRLRYIEDPIFSKTSTQHHCLKNSIDKLNDGQCTPMPGYHSAFNHSSQPHDSIDLCHQDATPPTVFHSTDQDVPFSSLPVIPYTPFDTTAFPEIRVSLPRPFAYSLQMYESFNPPPPVERTESNDSCTSLTAAESLSARSGSQSIPSFTEYLPQSPMGSTPTSPSTSLRSSLTTFSTDESTHAQTHKITARPPLTKTYTVICQYTRKGKSRASETTTLAPEGSTFEFAIDVFKKFFRKKTGLEWENVNHTHNSGNVVNRKDDAASAGATEGVTSSMEGSAKENIGTGNTSENGATLQQGTAVIDLTSDDSDTSKQIIDLTEKDALPSSVSKTTASADIDHLSINTSSSPTLQTQPKTPSTPSTASSLLLPETTTTPEDTSRNTLPVMGTLPSMLPHRPFTYIPTDQKVYVDGNEKYKASYEEDLFVFRHE